MLELLKESLVIYAMPATILLTICLVYWLFVILGALDIDAVDIGTDVGVDVDMDLDAESSGDGVGGGSAWSSVIHFFNLVEIPAIVFLSVMSAAFWFSVVSLNSVFNPAQSLVIGFSILVGCFFVSLFFAKLCTQPLKPLFKRLYEGEEHLKIVGHEAIIKTSKVDEQFGQIEIEKDGAPLVLNARVAEGAEPILKGETVIVYRENRKDGIYFVRKN